MSGSNDNFQTSAWGSAKPPKAGASQRWLRDHNERLVLTKVRDSGEIPSAEIARSASLSAQTASIITRSLKADGLLLEGAPQKGRVGKPSVPVRLNPDGLLAFGLRVGRRGATLILMDVTGNIRHQTSIRYLYPAPQEIHDFVAQNISQISDQLPKEILNAIVGIGIAAPFQLWDWLEVVDGPKEQMNAWKAYDFASEFEKFTALPVVVANDATMACNGELNFGLGKNINSFLYFYIGSFIGGGLVSHGKIQYGDHGNAAAFGSIPVGDINQKQHQLIHNASIYVLETEIAKQTGQSFFLWGKEEEWKVHQELVDLWCDGTGKALAQAIVATVAVMDTETIVIDGGFPAQVRAQIVTKTRAALDDFNLSGIVQPVLHEGTLGVEAGAKGAAFHPINLAHFV